MLATVLSAAQTGIQRHLHWIYRITTKRPAAVCAICCLVFALSCLAIARIEF
ncbi:hypothetical protein L4X63_07750 [Geomonas sp. Red32]|uniref:hypothetical protein n=1 Tax=Geomonas sp. Red32 TaxID=2912856 RepID=UPI00202D03CA|nr:hypothetical protein [Geomonas sp. Red32]MCM0081479.1 hypothetical protein [Geomonas sp. Red32]